MKVRAVLPPLKDIYGYKQTAYGVSSLQAIETRFLALVCQHMGFSYEKLLPVDGQFGFLQEDGNWTGIIGMIQRNEADLSVAHLAITSHRMQAIDFSDSYWSQDQSFMTELPSLLPKTYFFLHPFHISVWLGCLCAMTFVSILVTLLRFRNGSFGSVLLHMFSVFCRQPIKVKRTTFCLNLILGHWFSFVNFITLSYSAVLLSFLAQPLKEKGMETIEDLSQAVKDGTYKALVPLGSSILQHLITSDNQLFQELGKTILLNHWTYDTREGIMDYFEYGTALIGPKIRFRGATFDRRFISKDSFGIWNVGIALNKHFCCKASLNTLLRRMVGAGLYQKILSDEGYKASLRFGSNEQNNSTRNPTLGVEDLYGVFVLLIIGYFLSCLAFIGELLWYRISKNYKGVEQIEVFVPDYIAE